MLTKKEIFILILYIVAYFAVVIGAFFLLVNFCPLLIPAIVFVPWLIAALKDGAKV